MKYGVWTWPKLTCKVHFQIAVWSLSKSIRAASFIENSPRISAKPITFQRNLLGKLPRNRPFFTNRFSTKLASKIPAKFPRICPWKSREIWLFFPWPTRSPVYKRTQYPVDTKFNSCGQDVVCFKYLKCNVLWIKLTNFAFLSYSLLLHGIWGQDVMYESQCPYWHEIKIWNC